MVGTSRRPNVATSPRRDVLTSRRWVNNIQVNNRQRRDASTSRRLNVATSQRRDVSASSAFSALKANGGADLEASGEWYESGHGNQSKSDSDLEEEPVICIFLYFGY